MSQTLFNLLEAVNDEASFCAFAAALGAERAKAESLALTPDGFQGEWANNTIEGFLEAAVAWAKDSGFGMRPGPKPTNVWQLAARFLWAGRNYE